MGKSGAGDTALPPPSLLLLLLLRAKVMTAISNGTIWTPFGMRSPAVATRTTTATATVTASSSSTMISMLVFSFLLPDKFYTRKRNLTATAPALPLLSPVFPLQLLLQVLVVPKVENCAPLAPTLLAAM